MMSLRIRTPTRLHFGLLGWGPGAERQFGGFGLMTDDPGLELTFEASETNRVEGPLAGRVLDVAKTVEAGLRSVGALLVPALIRVVRAPEEHVGLGVGTQLSLAVALGMSTLAGLRDLPVETLARWTGRGLRSGVGIHGFREGGLIVDAGRRSPADVPTKLIRLAFPDAWSVLLARPASTAGLHGADEIHAFGRLPTIPPEVTDRLCRMVILELAPAVIENDLPTFGNALSRVQTVVGNLFAPVQRGRFATPDSEGLIRHLADAGLVGTGQSSWGPYLYGFTDASEPDRERLRRQLVERSNLPLEAFTWTQGSNEGAVVTIDD